ncbi:hypothetical protein [Flavobacterium sp. FPG59]|jgi:hypothetical protein|uniref:hypothetical protein n=1 Tax=Flavobacterium sp. FPG59 TaxID=1929267 RepID=UPI000A37EC46|nr:hypothetical protein [Flavobacterium sp. FPG59]OUD36562.1 hypothetical protein FPG59_05475 [Flavobacterium sp. FPG59]
MKKLVFIALAVVAFSGAAMAKTEEVKEVKEETLFTDCSTVAQNKLEKYEKENGCLTGTQATLIYKLFYNRCVSDNKVPHISEN